MVGQVEVSWVSWLKYIYLGCRQGLIWGGGGGGGISPLADVPPVLSKTFNLVIATFLAEIAKESKCIVCASHFPSLRKYPVSIPDRDTVSYLLQ